MPYFVRMTLLTKQENNHVTSWLRGSILFFIKKCRQIWRCIIWAINSPRGNRWYCSDLVRGGHFAPAASLLSPFTRGDAARRHLRESQKDWNKFRPCMTCCFLLSSCYHWQCAERNTTHRLSKKKSSYLKWQSERSPFATEETAAPHLLSSLCRPARSAVCTDMNFAMCAPQRGQRLCAAAAAAAAADKWTGNWWRGGGGAGGGGGGGEVVGGLGGISILVRVDSLKSLEEPFKRFLRGL